MEVRKCDRCGAIYDGDMDWISFNQDSEYDICPECAKSFKTWLSLPPYEYQDTTVLAKRTTDGKFRLTEEGIKYFLADQIKVKYHADILPLEWNEKGDWIDLRAAEDYEIKKGNSYHISLGVSMQLPDGYEAHIAPRSSTFDTWGIIQTNSVGLIDNSYCGDNDIWSMPIYATEDTTIKKNDRICQFRIVRKQPKFEFETVESLGNEDRGGFGSTGRN